MNMRALAKAGPDMAREVASIMQSEVAASVAQGRSIDGVAWAPKKDGGKPLANAAAHVTAKAIGNVAIITLRGVEVFHHYGAGRVPRRPILPSGGIAKFGNAIRKGIITMAGDFLTRGGRHDKGAKGHKWTPSMGGGK